MKSPKPQKAMASFMGMLKIKKSVRDYTLPEGIHEY